MNDFEHGVVSRGYARLAFCLSDMNGQIGRVDGSVGVALKQPFVELLVKTTEFPKSTLCAPCLNGDIELLEGAWDAYKGLFPKIGNVQIEQLHGIPSHSGLGSGTQMRLALLDALNEISEFPYSCDDLLRLSGRGGASGVGVWSHQRGGMVVDCGHAFGDMKKKRSFLPSSAANCGLPPLIWQSNFPSEWVMVCITPVDLNGASGQDEIDLFTKSCPISRQEADRMASLIFMGLVPAVIERDIHLFRDSIDAIQRTGFKRLVWAMQSPILHTIREMLRTQGYSGIGVSSLGPTLYCVTRADKAFKTKNDFKEILNSSNIEGEVWVAEVQNSRASKKPPNNLPF